MEPTLTFDQLPHVVSGLSTKIDRLIELLEGNGPTNSPKDSKLNRRIVHAKEACQILGKSLSTLYRGIKDAKDPIPSYKRGKLLYFYEDELIAWIEGGRRHRVAPSFAEQSAAMTAGMRRKPRGGYNF